MELSIVASHRGRRALLELSGVLDIATVPYLRRAVLRCFDEHTSSIVVDVGGVRLLDAASIRALLHLRDYAEHRAADLRLAAAGGTVLQALEIAGVAKALGAYDDADWPAAHRERTPLDLRDLAAPGRFPPDVTDRLVRLRQADPADPAYGADRAALIEDCLPAARRLAGRYAAAGEPIGDLTQTAALALVKAVDGFDPARGLDFGSYATPTILGELRRYFRDHAGGVRLPRRLQELRLRVARIRDELTQSLRRTPTAADLAAHLGADPAELTELFAAEALRPLSLDGPAWTAPASADQRDATLAETIAADASDLALVEYRESLRRLIVRLPAQEQQILALRFYGNLSQSEIAERIGRSQMHVSRGLRHALSFLQRHLQA